MTNSDNINLELLNPSKNWTIGVNNYVKHLKEIKTINQTIINKLDVSGIDISNNLQILSGKLLGPSNLIIDPKPHFNIGGQVTIYGDLVVEGVTTTVNSTSVDICDSILTLNKGDETSFSQYSGIEIYLGNSNPKPQLLWNNNDSPLTLSKQWQLKYDNANDDDNSFNDLKIKNLYSKNIINSEELNVSGHTTLQDLSAGATDISNGLVVNGLTQLNHDLIVNGHSTLQDLSAGATDISNGLVVNGLTQLNHDLIVNGHSTLQDLSAGATDISNGLVVNGLTQLNNDLLVSGHSTLQDLSVNNDINFNGKLLYNNSSISKYLLDNSLNNIQVKNSFDVSYIYITDDSEFVDCSNNFSLSIEPSSVSRKILVNFNFNYYCSDAYDEQMRIQICRKEITGSNEVIILDNKNLGTKNGSGYYGNYSCSVLDQPSISNKKIIYYVKFKLNSYSSYTNLAQGIVNINTNDENGSSSISLIEF